MADGLAIIVLLTYCSSTSMSARGRHYGRASSIHKTHPSRIDPAPPRHQGARVGRGTGRVIANTSHSPGRPSCPVLDDPGQLHKFGPGPARRFTGPRRHIIRLTGDRVKPSLRRFSVVAENSYRNTSLTRYDGSFRYRQNKQRRSPKKRDRKFFALHLFLMTCPKWGFFQ